MTAWALLLEYDGTAFCGWQRQRGQPSLQARLEQAAARLNGGAPVACVAAGRTDAGVHASGQVAMLSLPDRYGPGQVRDGLNFHLRPDRLVVVAAAVAPHGWHPRFSAVGRGYEYRISNRRARPALGLNRVWHVERPLDADAMNEAGQHLVGLHDFTSFRASSCQAKSPVRTLEVLRVAREGDDVVIHAEARSFLHHQVRNMAGTLKLVGEGRWRAEQVAAALAGRARRLAGPTAPPDGLILLGVSYDTDPFLDC